jgi:transcriptional regulator GlxA family with amidase domain
MRIGFYLQQGVEILDFAGPMEVFAMAGFEVITISKTTDPIVSQGILKIIPDYSIDYSPNLDMLVFFGGNSSNAYQDSEVISWVRSQRDVPIHFSVCSGAFILAEAGILDSKSATTFHSRLDQLEVNYPYVKVERNVRFVDNGTVVTSAGVSAGIDAALHLVTVLKGFELAKKVANYMEYDKWNPEEGLILNK